MKVVKTKLVTLNSSGALQARLNDCDSTSATEVRKQQTKHRSWKPLWNRHWWLCMSRWANSTQICDPELSEVGVRFNRAKIFYRSDSTRSMESMKTSIVTSWWSFECWMLLKSSVKFKKKIGQRIVNKVQNLLKSTKEHKTMLRARKNRKLREINIKA